MSPRLRFYRLLRDSPGCWVRWFLANTVVLFGCGALVVLLDLTWGSLTLRWGLDVWFGFLSGFTGVVLFNSTLEFFSDDYKAWKASHQGHV